MPLDRLSRKGRQGKILSNIIDHLMCHACSSRPELPRRSKGGREPASTGTPKRGQKAVCGNGREGHWESRVDRGQVKGRDRSVREGKEGRAIRKMRRETIGGQCGTTAQVESEEKSGTYNGYKRWGQGGAGGGEGAEGVANIK